MPPQSPQINKTVKQNPDNIQGLFDTILTNFTQNKEKLEEEYAKSVNKKEFLKKLSQSIKTHIEKEENKLTSEIRELVTWFVDKSKNLANDPSYIKTVKTKQETPPPLEPLLTNYDTQKQSLITLGLLDSSGAYTVEGQTYSYPTKEEVTNKLLDMDPAVLEKKIEQGFTRLHITPNGLPYQKYIDTLIDLTKKKAVKKSIADPAKPTKTVDKYYLTDSLGNEIEFNPKEPLWKWDGHDANDWTTGGISEIDHTKNTKGFDITLLEDDLNLPRENTNQVVGGRVRIEANKTPKEYLVLLEKANTNTDDPNYKVSGMSRQELITLYINTLDTQGVALDNFKNGKNSAAYAVASKKDSDVAMLYWFAGFCQWYVRRQGVGDRFGNGSVRVSVRV